MNPFGPRLYEIALATHIGKVRKGSPNQDYIKVVEPDLFHRQPPLLIVADGMGGHAGGTLASKCVVDTIKKIYRKEQSRLSPKDFFMEAVRQAHNAVNTEAKKGSRLSRMGSTVVASILDDQAIYLVNVGDSRLYLLRGCNIEQVSYDQSVVAEKVRQGEITAEEARNHPQKNELTMSISAHRQEVIPYYAEQELEFEDVILLCSDGLWGTVPEAYLRTVACQLPPKQAVRKLIQLANSLGGPDNISVIIARRVGSSLETDGEVE